MDMAWATLVAKIARAYGNAAGARTTKLIEGARLHVVKGGQHRITWTHAEEVNAQLLSFLGEKAQAKKNVAGAATDYDLPADTSARQFFKALIAKRNKHDEQTRSR